MAAAPWTVRGNRTTTSQEFLGTINARPLIVKTGGREALRVDVDGNVRIGGQGGAVLATKTTRLRVGSAGGFTDPQMVITQERRGDLVRLRFSGGGASGPTLVGDFWDIAVGQDGVHFFHYVRSALGTHGRDVATLTEAGLQVHGTATVEVLEITGGADLAEDVPLSEGTQADPGTVLVIDPDNPGHLRASDVAYDPKVAGVVSGAHERAPGLVVGRSDHATRRATIALAGQVFCKAEARSERIRPGDLLTTSDLQGHAMKVSDLRRATGCIVGKAMTDLTSGTGFVNVLVAPH